MLGEKCLGKVLQPQHLIGGLQRAGEADFISRRRSFWLFYLVFWSISFSMLSGVLFLDPFFQLYLPPRIFLREPPFPPR